MRDDRQEFILDTASQRLYFRAEEGRPSATPTVGTADSGNSALTAAAATYVTQNSVNTTIANSAAKGATSVVVTSATGIAVGDQYLLGNHISQSEWAEVKSIASTTIELTKPLRHAYTTLSTTYGTFVSTEWYYTLQEDDYETLSDLNIATATYVVGGLTYTKRIAFDIVRVPLMPPGPLLAAAVYRRLGHDLARQESDEQRGSDYASQRDAAWRIVRRRIYQHASDTEQWRPALVVDPSDLFEYGISVFTRICHEQGINVLRVDPAPMRQELLAEEELERSRAFASISWMDKDDDAALGEQDERPLALDFIR